MQGRTLSIVIEWENVLLAEMDRCRAMLRELGSQITSCCASGNSQIASPVDIAVAYCIEDVEKSLVESVLAAALPRSEFYTVRMLAAGREDSGYYALKNFAAKQVASEMLVFLDSDVVPEPGWLQSLTEPFADTDIQVVGGNSYIGPDGLIAKSFALFWFFPLRAAEAKIEPHGHFFANNVAFRKKTFDRFPFPEIKGASRGSCSKLSRTLKEAGIGIFRHTGAQVNHPPPNGFRHFLVRGIAQGRDECIYQQILRSRPAHREAWLHVNKFLKELRSGLKRLRYHRRNVKVSVLDAPLVVAAALIYFGVRLCGAWMTILFPHYMTAHFRI